MAEQSDTTSRARRVLRHAGDPLSRTEKRARVARITDALRRRRSETCGAASDGSSTEQRCLSLMDHGSRMVHRALAELHRRRYYEQTQR
jgi:hypothetical protein